MKLKHTLAAFAALALIGTASAATFDAAKNSAPHATNAQTGQMQVDAAEKATGNIFTAKYRGHEGVNQLQATNGYQYGVDKLAAKWTDYGQAKKPQFSAATSSPLLANADKTSLLSAEAKKPVVTDLAAGKTPSLLSPAFSNYTSVAVNDVGTKGATIQLPNGQVLANATDVGRAGLILGDITLAG